MEEAGDAEEKSGLEHTPNNMYVGGTPEASAPPPPPPPHTLGAVTSDHDARVIQGPAAGLEYK